MSRYWDIDKDIEEFPNMYTAHEFHDEDKEASADLFYQSAGGYDPSDNEIYDPRLGCMIPCNEDCRKLTGKIIKEQLKNK
jgi:hypothetical protein